MDRIEIEATEVTPYILLDVNEGIFILEGRSLLNNALGFYEPIITSIKNLANAQPIGITVELRMEYFNTSTVKCLFILFTKVAELKSAGFRILVNWYSDEDDLDHIEIGEDFETMSGIGFNFIYI